MSHKRVPLKGTKTITLLATEKHVHCPHSLGLTVTVGTNTMPGLGTDLGERRGLCAQAKGNRHVTSAEVGRGAELPWGLAWPGRPGGFAAEATAAMLRVHVHSGREVGVQWVTQSLELEGSEAECHTGHLESSDLFQINILSSLSFIIGKRFKNTISRRVLSGLNKTFHVKVLSTCTVKQEHVYCLLSIWHCSKVLCVY